MADCPMKSSGATLVSCDDKCPMWAAFTKQCSIKLGMIALYSLSQVLATRLSIGKFQGSPDGVDQGQVWPEKTP